MGCRCKSCCCSAPVGWAEAMSSCGANSNVSNGSKPLVCRDLPLWVVDESKAKGHDASNVTKRLLRCMLSPITSTTALSTGQSKDACSL